MERKNSTGGKIYRFEKTEKEVNLMVLFSLKALITDVISDYTLFFSTEGLGYEKTQTNPLNCMDKI